MVRTQSCLLALCIALGIQLDTRANDWLQFRGPNGTGVDVNDEKMPTRWSPQQNVKWKTSLPGAGFSSPIVVGDRIFVTCYSGYGLDRSNPGDINDLKRHLVCLDADSGDIIWDKSVDAVQPEDPYSGAGVPTHGYASHTPVSDGENVYVFFGKTGALAFDMDGNQLWHTQLGKESDPARWGSSSSPILADDKVIVTASCESQALVALDKKTGKEVWRQEASGTDNLWGTPSLAETKEGKTEIVIGVAGEVWGINPDNGKLCWYCNAGDGDQAATSAVVSDGMVISVGGRGSGSIAVRPGGEGNVTESHVAWTGRDGARFASPVVFDGQIYTVANNVVSQIDVKTGEESGQLRLTGGSGGRGRSSDYASPIVANGNLYFLKGNGDVFVLELGDEIKQVAYNRLTTEQDSFGGSPAVSNGRLFIRSNKHLYCVVDGPFDESAEPKTEEAEPSGDDGAGERPNRQRGGQRFDPAEFFNRMDQNSDGKLSGDEFTGPFADRSGDMDTNGDGSITLEEFQNGLQNMRRRGGGNRGGNRGVRGGGGDDNRPDRPQRPPFDEGIGD